MTTEDANGDNRNRLRLWEKSDFVPRPDDIFQERLYCIQWITKESRLDKGRQETFFASVTEDDLERERQGRGHCCENLARWQDEGLVPDMPIEPGEENDTPIPRRVGGRIGISCLGLRHLAHLRFLIGHVSRQAKRAPLLATSLPISRQ